MATETPVERVQEALEVIAAALLLDVTVELEEDEDGLYAEFVGDDVAPLIGHHGATLDAIQHLASRIAYQGTSSRGHVTVDAGGYRERREEALEAIADQAAVAAIRDGRPVPLEAMNAAERRVVHEYLKDRHEVETYSEGEEPKRHLVVAPVVS
jgi:spoIIIJ-associated protein